MSGVALCEVLQVRLDRHLPQQIWMSFVFGLTTLLTTLVLSTLVLSTLVVNIGAVDFDVVISFLVSTLRQRVNLPTLADTVGVISGYYQPGG